MCCRRSALSFIRRHSVSIVVVLLTLIVPAICSPGRRDLTFYLNMIGHLVDME